ncbi:hypothetical protein EVAR_4146_1 [Eumeta japonica]|uniref:Uncharacterized protein n=1 Tax=Eumeta variegata TaxID=151549 RepID=A0A4C1TIG9_EUMVA|nr:hypothetical protein EVAR_4146_1 [Eumeta japonica]
MCRRQTARQEEAPRTSGSAAPSGSNDRAVDTRHGQESRHCLGLSNNWWQLRIPHQERAATMDALGTCGAARRGTTGRELSRDRRQQLTRQRQVAGPEERPPITGSAAADGSNGRTGSRRHSQGNSAKSFGLSSNKRQ